MRPRYDVTHLREAERVEDLCLQLEYDHPVAYAVAVAKKHAEEAAAPALQLRGGRA